MLGAAVKILVGVALSQDPNAASLSLSPELLAEVERLEGHEVRIANGRYEILDVAGEGPPRVGLVRKTDRGLELVTDEGRWPLRGPLAVPRIAGPNYKVWVIGAIDVEGNLEATRLGILAGPKR